MNRRDFSVLAFGMVTGLQTVTAKENKDYPVKAITLVLPVAAGTSIDVISRAIATEVSKAIGQPVVVDNKPGASGNIGAAAVANAPADGYTLLVANSNLAMVPALIPKLQWDPQSTFTAVSSLFSGTMCVAIGAHVPADSLAALIRLLKESPEKYAYATPGMATPHHFASELFMQSNDVKMLHVPYKGTNAAVVDLVAGRVDVAYFSLGNLIEHHLNGKLKILAIADDKRNTKIPNVPTLKEVNQAQSDVRVWAGVFARSGTDQGIISKLESAFQKALSLQHIREMMAGQSVSGMQGTAAELQNTYSTDLDRWPAVVKKANIKLSN